MLTKQEITEGNDVIRIFMNYEFHKQVLVDFSDCGGIYDRIDMYSKVPIEYTEYDEEQIYLVDGWWGKNSNDFFYKDVNEDCKYNTSWDWLIPVAKKCSGHINLVTEAESEYLFAFAFGINLKLLEMEIEGLWQAVVDYIKRYNEVCLMKLK
jgi:hypothetical protein